MTDKRVVLTTSGSPDEARKLAHALVERRLAACVNIIPRISSVYRWQGKVEEAEEFLLLIKTTEAAFEQVRQTIRELHSYELPECIALPVEDGSLEYLKWIEDSVGPHRGLQSEI
jgi:periplasmic divalent cation tolerance protein